MLFACSFFIKYLSNENLMQFTRLWILEYMYTYATSGDPTKKKTKIKKNPILTMLLLNADKILHQPPAYHPYNVQTMFRPITWNNTFPRVGP